MKPRLLDLFCCQGGAARGYADAGFEVFGVDIEAQKRYPYPMSVADAAGYPLDGFDAVHASPPCEDHSDTMAFGLKDRGTGWLLGHTIKRLRSELPPGVPWVVENVVSASTLALMPGALMLCGSEFSLGAPDSRGQYRVLRRHRLFLSNVELHGNGGCQCQGKPVGGVYGHGEQGVNGGRGYGFAAAAAREALGMPWASRDGCAEAIPPAYTEHIGRQLLAYLRP